VRERTEDPKTTSPSKKQSSPSSSPSPR
jgi:hypothetical protein